jgi:hypothetical protein
MKNAELSPFHIIGHDIKVALDNGASMGAVILTYAAIDAMAFLSMPEAQVEVKGKDFIWWTEKYLKADSRQPYQYRGIDLYGARCGLFHRYSATSTISDSGKCSVFGYHDGSEHIYKPVINKNVVLISWSRFVNDFFGAMKVFLKDIIDNEELKKRVDKRIDQLLHIMDAGVAGD